MSLKKPAVVLENGTLHVFRRRVNGSLRYSKGIVKSVETGEREWNSSNMNTGGSAMSSAPTAVYRHEPPNQYVDVFWRNSAGKLHHAWYKNSNEWQPGTAVSSAALSSAPAATRSGSDYTFWRHADSTLYSTWHNRTHWEDKQLVSDRLLSDPSTLAISSGDVIDVFWTSLQGEVKRTYGRQSSWQTELISDKEPRIDADALPQRLVNSLAGLRVYWRGVDCLLYEARRGNTSWTQRRIVRGEMASDPAPLYGPESGRIHVFWKSPDGILMDSVCGGASESEPGTWRRTPYALTKGEDDAPVISEPVALMDTVSKDGSSRVFPRVLWVSVDDDLYETYYTSSERWVTRLVDE